jgi:DNA-binding transcriptional ArsR family regulator
MAKRSPDEGASPRTTLTVTDLEQVRALADPLRLRILGALVGAARTTMQVAELLGERPTKLYHHVEALRRAGLIRLVETRPNRGTTEKYYRAVAAQFHVAASALSPAPVADEKHSEVEAILGSILDMAREDVQDHLHKADAARPKPGDAPLMGRILVRGSGKKVEAIRRRLMRWIEQLQAAEAECDTPRDDDITYAFTIVLCRKDRT